MSALDKFLAEDKEDVSGLVKNVKFKLGDVGEEDDEEGVDELGLLKAGFEFAGI